MKPVQVYQPKFQVLLHKTVSRKSLGDGAPTSPRFTDTDRTIDLTPYFGEGSSIRTTKGVRQPAGTFTLTIPDKPYAGVGRAFSAAETLAALVEPQDMVEIRMQRDPSTGGVMPIVMRGFVSQVRRTQSAGSGPDGRVSRSVVIAGQDYGKLWQQLQVNYLPGYVVGEDTLTAFKLYEQYGVGFQTATKAADFVRTTLAALIDPYIQRIVTEDSRLPRTLVLDEDLLVQHGTTSFSGSQNKEGTVYDLLRTFCDVGAWNELYLEDREDGVYCVFRPNPYKKLDGTPVVEDALLPPTVEVPALDIVSLDLGRSDENVANYFWVRAPRFEQNDDMLMRQDQALGAQADTVVLKDYANTAASLYGVKAMFLTTEMGGDDVQTFNSGLPEKDKVAREALMANWQNYRRRILVDSNKDNVVLESGGARVKGNPLLRAGCYVQFTQGKLTTECYVPTVTQDFLPLVGFFTTLELERGTGFVQRAARGGGADSPFYAELSQ